MDTPKPTANQRLTPAAQLREDLSTYFEVGDLESLCFDLGVDYEGVPGESKAAKIVGIIEYFSRAGRSVDLLERCSQMRPNVDWAGLRAIAASNPEAFIAITPPGIAEKTEGNILNVPPDRALKLGIGVGVLLVVILLCGFSGGLLASRFVAVSFNPVPVSQPVGVAALSELSALQTLAPGDAVLLQYDNVKATSLADQLLVKPNAPISEIHTQFLDGNTVAINARLTALGNRRVVIGYGVRTENGRMILTPQAAAIDLLNLKGTSFGWLVIPVGLVMPFSTGLQAQLDSTAKSYSFERVGVKADHLALIVRRR